MANLWDAFAARAEADPEAPALIFGDDVTSFGELSRLAHRGAATLAARGIGPGSVVTLQLPKRRTTYALLLTCLRLGAPYVFLDPKNPPERSARIVERLRPTILFTEGAALNPHGQVLCLTQHDDMHWMDADAPAI